MTRYPFRKSRQRLLEEAMDDRQRRRLQRSALNEFRSLANTAVRIRTTKPLTVVPVEAPPVDRRLSSWQRDILSAIERSYRLPEKRVLR